MRLAISSDPRAPTSAFTIPRRVVDLTDVFCAREAEGCVLEYGVLVAPERRDRRLGLPGAENCPRYCALTRVRAGGRASEAMLCLARDQWIAQMGFRCSDSRSASGGSSPEEELLSGRFDRG